MINAAMISVINFFRGERFTRSSFNPTKNISKVAANMKINSGISYPNIPIVDAKTKLKKIAIPPKVGIAFGDEDLSFGLSKRFNALSTLTIIGTL